MAFGCSPESSRTRMRAFRFSRREWCPTWFIVRPTPFYLRLTTPERTLGILPWFLKSQLLALACSADRKTHWPLPRSLRMGYKGSSSFRGTSILRGVGLQRVYFVVSLLSLCSPIHFFGIFFIRFYSFHYGTAQQ
jgi:hypothetical protein